MHAQYRRWIILPVLACLLVGCGAPVTPRARRGAAVAATATRQPSASPSRTPETATIPPPPSPSRVAGTPATPRSCAAASGSYAGFDSLATLAWASEQIVAGVVTEQLAPIAIPLDPQDPASARLIYTDSVVRVDRQLRGLPVATVIVRRQGGTLDGCSYENPNLPPLAVGDAVLLFLGAWPPSNESPPAFFTLGGPQGHWRLRPDGTVAPILPHAFREAAGTSLADVAAQVRAALSAPPPRAAPPGFFVPLDRAPLPPEPTPATPTR